MATYRLYLIGKATGRPERSELIEARDDMAAIRHATETHSRQAWELWRGERRLHAFKGPPALIRP
jgi:hypothetical protein